MADQSLDQLKALLPQCMLPDWVRLGSRLARLLTHNRHPEKQTAILDRLTDEALKSIALRRRRLDFAPQPTYPSELPITAKKSDIINAIVGHQVVIVSGETGSGKTTQIPKMCLEAGLGIEAKIGCTQPRRVAAQSISRRIAEELDRPWGKEVGCKIRFEDHSSPYTYIKLMTDGILLAETQADPLLSEYNALIIDEAHERSLNIDFLLGYLKSLLARRKDLKLIVTSATIDTQAFSKAFDDAPIVEVSGRVYPVSVTYAPLDGASEESGEITYIDAAVQAVEKALCETGSGDVLVFMPTERDIRETGDQVCMRFGSLVDVVPLFGRLSSAEQQRVFAHSEKRKIVIATNIAETSLTIPGIRFVIDSGLARISRYNPRTRTKRLPVEPISQSSANQRKGRAGRVQDGVCIRLYSEDDFKARAEFTQPEIQRANLAEVILRMKAFSLGEIETFAFVNPPTQAAIHNGYLLLHELGALDEARMLTPLGRDMARLPIDPTLSRMLIQSHSEHATRELLIIASGLSVQDPRERPLDQKEAAAAAHKKYIDPQSDFLTLLNIWDAVHEQWETFRTQGQRRRFCKANFLSYTRMREWQELHAMIQDVLENMNGLQINEGKATYAAIHRSILPGLLGQVANRSGRNVYKAAGTRQVSIFPGSVLHDRSEPSRKGAPTPPGVRPARTPASQQPLWIMSGEIVETSQLFARTNAGIDPLWIIQLAPHLCRFSHHDPHWSAQAGRVLVTEKTTLLGLEIRHRKIDYETLNPRDATRIFIQSALIEGDLFPEPGAPRGRSAGILKNLGSELKTDSPAGSSNGPLTRHHSSERDREGDVLPSRFAFLEQNRKIREKVETWRTRARRNDLQDLDQALHEFYSKQLGTVSSIHKLNQVLMEHPGPAFLQLKESDLTGEADQPTYDIKAFPDAVTFNGQPVPLSYAYAPGEEQDGVTIRLMFEMAESLSPASVDWAIPGLREGQIGELLRSLPKSIRRQLMPFPPKIMEIARDLRPTSQSLLHDLAAFIKLRYHVEVTSASWQAMAIPPHLRPRLEIVGNDLRTLAAGRGLLELRSQLKSISIKPAQQDQECPEWLDARRRFERFDVRGWCFGDLPEKVLINETGGLPIYAWPAIQLEDQNVNLRLLKSQEAARTESLKGVRRLVEIMIERDLAWAAQDLRALSRYDALIVTLCSPEKLREDALEHLKNHVLPADPLQSLTQDSFNQTVLCSRDRLRACLPSLVGRIGDILQCRQTIALRFPAQSAPNAARPVRITDFRNLVRPGDEQGTTSVAAQVEAILPKHFLRSLPFERLQHIPRYLKAIAIRADRAAVNPVKDRERARLIAPYLDALNRLLTIPDPSREFRKHTEEFRWMIEEFKVSVFAQELGTAIPVSTKRLDRQLECARNAR